MRFIPVYRYADKQITQHFKEREFFCKCADYREISCLLDRNLIAAAEVIRSFAGVPVYVSSSFRTPLGNSLVGGAENSYHLKGMALDLRCPTRQSIINENIIRKGRLYELLRQLEINGFGFSDYFLHIDTRLSGFTPDPQYGTYSFWWY
jgi:uncharacterized protein YcbK (DUF882 family)